MRTASTLAFQHLVRDKYSEGMRICLLLAAMRHILLLNLINKFRTRNAHSSSEYSFALEGRKWYLWKTVSGLSYLSGLPKPFPYSFHYWAVSKAPPHWAWTWFSTTWRWTCHLTVDFCDCWDSELTLGASPARLLLMPCVTLMLNHQNKRGYFRSAAFSEADQESLSFPRMEPHCWSGMMVSPQRHQESAVGTVHVLPQWSAEQQPQETARIQPQQTCCGSFQRYTGGKESGWHPGTVKLEGTGDTQRLHNPVL